MKILVIRLSSIGDVILTTPVLTAVKKKFPEAQIDFMVMDKFKAAISGNKHINHLILFEKKRYRGISGIQNFARSLKTMDYDLVIDLHAKIRSLIICHELKTKVLRYKKRAWWKTLGVRLRLIRYQVDDTIVKNYFKPLKSLGIAYNGEHLEFNFSQADEIKVQKYKNSVVMAPGAANPTKKWPGENFAELGRMLNQNIVLVGGKDEFEEFESIRRRIGSRCTNLSGKLTLKESGALMAGSKYVVTNDSGPFHIARGVGKKVFVIFGPTDPEMFEYDDDS
ncbi:glycosyltransferase family 9 protein, partial [bacterium]|nr:glycosyltransferase family 9 protein [bacterium]